MEICSLSLKHEALRAILPEQIGALARDALAREAALSPKPGLVDAENSGAHRDMDLALLIASANALKPYFVKFAEQGAREANLSPTGRLSAIRADGMEAEKVMLAVTCGVNTHKGALFLLGVLCYSAGYCSANGMFSTKDVCAAGAKLCTGITAELGANAGRAFARYGARGARGEAEDGFLHAQEALKVYSIASARGTAEDDCWLLSLLTLIASVEDANVLARCGEETALALQQRALALVKRYPSGGAPFTEEIRMLDRDCRAWNASPGGAADLLACAMFLDALCEKEDTIGSIP